jgi:hypothetical protein
MGPHEPVPTKEIGDAMPLAAIMTREPKLSLDEWLAYIPSNTSLVVPPPERVNPFTHEPYRTPPSVRHVEIHDGGRAIGAIEPDSEFDTNGELLVSTVEKPDERVTFIVSQISADLRARIEWIYEEDE